MKICGKFQAPLRMVHIWTGYWAQSDRVTDTQGCCILTAALQHKGMQMGEIFLFLISINSSTCYAHRGIKYHFPTFSIFFWIQRKHSKYYRIGTPFSNRLIERGLQAATKIFLNQNHKLRYRHMSKVVSLSSLGGLMGLWTANSSSCPLKVFFLGFKKDSIYLFQNKFLCFNILLCSKL